MDGIAMYFHVIDMSVCLLRGNPSDYRSYDTLQGKARATAMVDASVCQTQAHAFSVESGSTLIPQTSQLHLLVQRDL